MSQNNCNEIVEQQDDISEYDSQIDYDDNIVKNELIGYPIDIIIDHKNKIKSTIIFDTISYDYYQKQIKMSGVKNMVDLMKLKFITKEGQPYNYWIPIKIPNNIFDQHAEHIKTFVAAIHNNIMNCNDIFCPEMILDVIIPILNKISSLFAKDDDTFLEKAIYEYIYLLCILYQIIEKYPELKKLINKIVESFYRSSYNRNRKTSGNLGEFVIKLFLSEYSWDDMSVKSSFLTEFFARQVYWMNKNDPELMNSLLPNRLQRAFAEAKISNQLFLYNLYAIKYFYRIIPDIINNNFILKDENMKEFIEIIKSINKINNYNTFIKMIDYYAIINTPEKMNNFIDDAILLSNKQQYTQIQRTHPINNHTVLQRDTIFSKK